MCRTLGQITKLDIILKDITPENMMVVAEFKPEYDANKKMDVHPENIPEDGMFDKLNVVLIDFGLAKHFACSEQVCEPVGIPLTVCILALNCGPNAVFI